MPVFFGNAVAIFLVSNDTDQHDARFNVVHNGFNPNVENITMEDAMSLFGLSVEEFWALVEKTQSDMIPDDDWADDLYDEEYEDERLREQELWGR